MSELINYYVFDRIEKDDLGCHWGYLGADFCEVFIMLDGESEQELMDLGYAKCDSPGWETMIVSESSYSALNTTTNT